MSNPGDWYVTESADVLVISSGISVKEFIVSDLDKDVLLWTCEGLELGEDASNTDAASSHSQCKYNGN